MRDSTDRRDFLIAGALALVLVLGVGQAVAAPLKLATLVPEGSIWDKDLRAMGDQWKRKTEGRVSLRIYAGGVAGSESDILRKMRIGQLHAAALTVTGLEEIDPAFSVLSMPLFYASFDEFLHVLDGLAPTLEERLEAKGYKLLQWGHGGWVRLFSRSAIRNMSDLRRQKIFVTAGSDHMVSLWKDNGFRPISLAPTDIMTGFQTGMIDVVATTPLAALSLQWFRQASFMQEAGLAPLVGATIVSERSWSKISAADQETLLYDAGVTEKRQRETIPEQDQIAVAEMSQRGLEVTAVDTSLEWTTTAEQLASSLRGGRVPLDLYDTARRLRDEFRVRAGSPSGARDREPSAAAAGGDPR